MPGRYKVVIVATEEIPAKDAGSGPGLRSLVPETETRPETTRIVVDVPPEGDKNLEIQVPG